MSQLYILQIFQNNIQSSQTYNYYFWLLWAQSYFSKCLLKGSLSMTFYMGALWGGWLDGQGINKL